MAIGEVCKAVGPDAAWAMRMDEALMLLAARVRLMERGQRQRRSEERDEPVRTRGDGKKEVAIKSWGGLLGFLKQGRK